MSILDEFIELVKSKWPDSRLEQLYDVLTHDQWRVEEEEEHLLNHFRIWLHSGTMLPHSCPICGSRDKWVKEGEHPFSEEVYVCEHRPIYGASFGCRNVASVRSSDVSRTELVNEQLFQS